MPMSYYLLVICFVWVIPESLNAHVYSLAALILENSDFDCRTNNRNHHTAEAGCTKLIVRRGQAFEIKLQFSPRGYEEGVDQLALIANTGSYIVAIKTYESVLPTYLPFAVILLE